MPLSEVPCCRLNTLLARHQITKIDLMVVDVEGADWMVVRQLSLDDYRPRLVYLEYAHLSGYEKTACAAHFRNHGYRIYIDQHEAENFLAVRPA
ncbi:MAG: FkbM family methyltransferase [Alphaproteobacteria bacterium]|nr:FkbM family methyltransferase [Alphaproteobacteria bacterium]